MIYEIYPRSFRDTTGTGEGDLKGIARGLEHVASLGVDAIWIAPFYPSPRADGGYDVTDHRAVDPRLGTLADFDALVARAHGLGLAVLIDMVFKHTSLEHPWFRAALDGDEAAAARYVWQDACEDGTAPTNWIGYFGSPAWSWRHERQQYYLHQYHAGQPALDHRNPEVQARIRDILQFWRARGVDGFRFDAVTSWFHDPEFRDNPPAPPEMQRRIDGLPFSPYVRQRHVNDMRPGEGAAWMERIRAWAGDRMYLIGENNFGAASVEIALGYAGPGRLDGCYTTDTVRCGAGTAIWEGLLKDLHDRWRLPWWFESHDQPRSPDHLGDGSPDAARFLLLLGSVLPGALMLYQGQELGLHQPELHRGEIEDPYDMAFWPDGPGRSGARVPLPWDETPGSWGFTAGTPWLPMRWRQGQSVAAQEDDPESVLAFARRALGLRRDLGFAAPQDVGTSAEEDVLRIDLETAAGRFRALLNFSAAPCPAGDGGTELLSVRAANRTLAPGGAVLMRIA